ncbi:MAG: diaminopimelate decarboxylase [Clostridia bacterium]|nr:diaminopimelate decarboxylase [Clostridia bacterium]
MNLHENMSVNEQGHLMISGCDTVLLAKRYGTPLYVLDEALVRRNCREAVNAMKKYFSSGRVMYASKALNTKAVLRIAEEEGLGIDTVSAGELYTALAAGVDPQKIELHGNSKSEEEIRMAVENSIYCIIADGFEELKRIERFCKKLNKTIRVSLRIRPNIDVHAHQAVQTARMDCKFGFGISDGQAIRAAQIVAKSEYMILHGIHCHIGSQIFDEKPFVLLCEHLVDFACSVREQTGVTLAEFNCGGGYGVRYTDADTPKSIDVFLRLMADTLHTLCRDREFPMPSVSIEPGRFIVGEAGTTLYTVNSLKEITGVRTYCMIDGGMFENIRTALYDAQYDAVCASRMREEANYPVSLAGRCCESGDMITWNSPMPHVKPGDVLAVFTTGAYNYSMASNYNRNPVPAMVLVENGHDELIVKRQSYEQIAQNDVLPARLGKEKTV